MSTSRKPNSYKPGSLHQYPAARGGTRAAGIQLLGIRFDERLAHYAEHPGAKRNRRPDGLTPRQYKRLIKKDRHLWQCSVA